MATTSLTIRMDEDLKKQAETLFNEIGLNMTTAFTVFVKAAVRQRKIPFELAAVDDERARREDIAEQWRRFDAMCVEGEWDIADFPRTKLNRAYWEDDGE